MDHIASSQGKTSSVSADAPISYNPSAFNNRKKKLLTFGILGVFALFLALSVFAVGISLENRSKAGFVNYPFFDIVQVKNDDKNQKSYDVFLDGSGVPTNTSIHTVSLTVGMGTPAVYGDSTSVEGDQLAQANPIYTQTTDVTINPGSGSGGSMGGGVQTTYKPQTCRYYVDKQLQDQSGCPAGYICQPGKVVDSNTEAGASVQLGTCEKVETSVKPTSTVSCTPRPSCLDQKPPCKIETFADPHWCTTTPTPTKTPSCTPRPSCLDAKPPCRIETFANPNWCPSPTPTKSTACDLKDLKSCSEGFICASPVFPINSSMGINPTAGNCIANNGYQIDCGKDKACPSGMVCYQPSMPPCAEGMACAQVMPVAKCVNPAALNGSITITPKPVGSNYSEIYKDGAGTSISAYTGGSSPAIFTWDKVTANPNGLGLVLGAKVVDNVNSQKALHTRFKVGTITLAFNGPTPQIIDQSIKGSMAGVKTDVELYQPKLKPTPTGTGQAVCGQKCASDSDCKNPSSTGAKVVCRNNICENSVCSAGKTLVGSSCSCDNSDRTCGQTCGSSAGHCAPGFTCRFINGDICKTDSTNSTSLCVPNTMPANWKTFMCTGGGNYYVTTNNQTRMGTPTVQEVQNMCRQVVTPTPTPTTYISCDISNINSCPNGWSCVTNTKQCDPNNPLCEQEPPHCVQKVTPTPQQLKTCQFYIDQQMNQSRSGCPTGYVCRPDSANTGNYTAVPGHCYTPDSIPTTTPTPVVSCAGKTCPAGYKCYQPPMPSCPAGKSCAQIMPAPYCVPSLPTPTVKNTVTPTPSAIGGSRDSHGCLISGGYSWCDAKQKCLRTWEEPCNVVTITVTPTRMVSPIPTGPITVTVPVKQWYCNYLPFLCR